VFAAAFFSLCINLLYLTVPIYSLQVYDRILPSSSDSTLAFLTVAALVALAVLAALDAVRSRVISRAGVRLERRLAAGVMNVSIERSLALEALERGQGLRDVEAVWQSLAGPAVLAVFDGPWIPVYLVALFMIHWSLGMLALAVGCVLVALAVANDRTTRAAAARAVEAGAASYQLTDTTLRNAEAVRAMGMFDGLAARWARERVAMMESQLTAGDRGTLFASAIKFERLFAQVLVLGASAYLAIRQAVTPGTTSTTSPARPARSGTPAEWTPSTAGCWAAPRSSISPRGSSAAHPARHAPRSRTARRSRTRSAGTETTRCGNAVANTPRGGFGNDTMDGRGGADTMIGEFGDDTYLVDDSGDAVVEARTSCGGTPAGWSRSGTGTARPRRAPASSSRRRPTG